MKIETTKLRGSISALAVGALLVGTAATAMAKPAYRGPIAATQPDGTTITIRLTGDEFSHAAFTEDGYPVVYDDNLGYVYADILSDGRLAASGIVVSEASSRTAEARAFLQGITAERIATAREYLGNRGMRQRVARKAPTREGMRRAVASQKHLGLCSDATYPVKGEQKGLVILVEYQDVKFGSSNLNFDYGSYGDGTAHGYWDDLLNKEGFDGNGGRGSCRDWFLQNSRNTKGNSQFSPHFDLYGPVTLPNNRRYYGNNNAYDNDDKAWKMVVDALDILDPEVDFSQYDRDGDGYIDNVYVFYAGFGEADSNLKYTVWPHSWNVTAGDNMLHRYDGVIVDRYACSNETDYVSKEPDGIGTFVHEFSHVMGLPDLYATSYGSSYTPGAYSVLDYGPYNGDGKCPPNYSAFERNALGWANPRRFGPTGEYELPGIVETNQCNIIPTEKDTEFFLVENRRQEGWDEFIPGHGMIIWHVDYVPRQWDDNSVNNTAGHQYVDLIEANLQRNAKYADGHTFPGTSNVTSYRFRSWAKVSCDIEFADIAESEDGLITMHVDNPNYQPGEDDIIEDDDPNGAGVGSIADGEDGAAEYYTLQGIRIAAPAAGEIVIEKRGKSVRKIRF